MTKKPVKKQKKTYSYKRKDGRRIVVPPHKQTYHMGKKKKTPVPYQTPNKIVDKRTKELYNEFDLSPIEANELNNILINAETTGSHDDVDNALEIANKMISGYRVEALEDYDRWINSYYQNTIGIYVNKGDTYDTTIIYDTAEKKFIVGNFGDFIETYEDK